MCATRFGRLWQMTTIQFDFNLPERFDMWFADRDGSQRRPIMVHRALHGALERFLGVLIEHYGGAFPMWLAPVQAVVIPVNPMAYPYALKVSGAAWRTRLSSRGESERQPHGRQDPHHPGPEGAVHDRGRRQGGGVGHALPACPATAPRPRGLEFAACVERFRRLVDERS